MRRFFIDPANIDRECATITDQEARHLVMALRLKPGNIIELFDGTGIVYQAKITSIAKSRVETSILARRYHQDEPPFLSLAQALVKGKKMDLIVQKATELGIATLQPIIALHCDIKAVPDSQTDRWQRIAHEACKQCGRPTPLLCLPALPLAQLLAQDDGFSIKIIFWEGEATTTLLDLPELRGAERVLALIGPEGGFSKQEAEAAIDHGFRPVALGPRILRAETAAIAAMAILQFLLGNLRPNHSSATRGPA